jgi:hypothetical protein
MNLIVTEHTAVKLRKSTTFSPTYFAPEGFQIEGILLYNDGKAHFGLARDFRAEFWSGVK